MHSFSYFIELNSCMKLNLQTRIYNPTFICANTISLVLNCHNQVSLRGGHRRVDDFSHAFLIQQQINYFDLNGVKHFISPTTSILFSRSLRKSTCATRGLGSVCSRESIPVNPAAHLQPSLQMISSTGEVAHYPAQYICTLWTTTASDIRPIQCSKQHRLNGYMQNPNRSVRHTILVVSPD